MNITTKGRYALRIMLDLAAQEEGEFISLKSIAERQGISMKYLEAIVGSLKKAGLVDSSRGKEGGYRLDRPAEDYDVYEILQCLEDNLAPVSCIRDGSVQCDNAAHCLTLPMWQELDGLIAAYLRGVTLRDLLTGAKWKDKIIDNT